MLKRPNARLAALLAVAMVAMTGASLAQSTPPSQGGRFTMQPADGGVLRLDTENGTLSLCKQRNGQWSCESLPDERAALDQEIKRLAKENEDLKGAVKRLEELAGIPQDKPARKSGPDLSQLPGPEDVDKAMTYLQSMLKKFRDKLKEFESMEGGRKTERL